MSQTIEQYNLQQKGATTLCWLARVTATAANGGNIKRIAFYYKSLILSGEIYSPAPFEMSQFQATAGLEVNNTNFSTVLADALSRLNIRGNLWQGATIELMLVDYQNMAAGYIERHVGRFGQAQIAGGGVEIEYRGLMQLLSQEIGERTSRLCRYQLGDARCKKNLADFTFSGTVTDVVNNQKFFISVSQPDGYFYRGQIRFTSGENLGLSMETQNNIGTTLTLFMPMPGEIKMGDAFQIIAGDDKRIETCYGKFNNAINFGGEPSIPEKTKLYKFPD